MKKKKPVYEGKMKLKKGDEVIVLSGKDRLDSDNRPKHGKIVRTIPEEGKVVIDGINMAKRHRKPRATSQRAMVKQQLGEMMMPMPMPVSKVQLICPKCNKPTRVGSVRVEDGSVARKCRKCDQLVDER